MIPLWNSLDVGEHFWNVYEFFLTRDGNQTILQKFLVPIVIKYQK